jgi:hypothetical protein
MTPDVRHHSAETVLLDKCMQKVPEPDNQRPMYFSRARLPDDTTTFELEPVAAIIIEPGKLLRSQQSHFPPFLPHEPKLNKQHFSDMAKRAIPPPYT